MIKFKVESRDQRDSLQQYKEGIKGVPVVIPLGQ